MLLTNKADPMLSGGEKNQLPIHILAQKATGAALVPLQLILKSCPKEARLAMDTVRTIGCRFRITYLKRGLTNVISMIRMETYRCSWRWRMETTESVESCCMSSQRTR